MTTSTIKFLNGKFNSFSNLKQISPRSWIVNDENEKTYVLNRYDANDKKAHSAYELNETLFKLPNSNFKNNFVFYEDHKIVDEYYFILIEYCREGDFNRFLIESRYKRHDNDDQIKNWILQLLRAVEFLNKNKIVHKKITTYTILVHNGQLKIDGFEYAQIVNDESSVISVDLKDNYGMFNCPELVKRGKINYKYHIWCIGWIIYEICTFEWKFYKLYNEKFDDWKSPNLPDSFSKSLNYLFKKMVKLSPTSRSKPEKLIKLASDYFSKEKIVRRKSDEISDTHSFKETMLKLFDQRFEKNFESKDDDEHMSDSDEESSSSKSDYELDVSEKFKEKNKTYRGKFNEYKIKEVIETTDLYSDFIAVTKNKKRRLIRVINYTNNASVKSELNTFRDIIKRIKDKSPFIVSLDECFDSDSKLCYTGEVFEEGTLDKTLAKLSIEKRNIHEDKIFDYIYYLFDAVSFLHENKIIHGEIKPRNIYLRNEKLKIGNFGIEYLLQQEIKNSLNNKDNMPCYFSPELISNGKKDSRIDVWSIGCVIYEMLKFEPLFLNKDLKNIAKGETIPMPNLECRKKIKNLFYTLIKPLNERPSSHEVFKQLNEMIKKERQGFENPRSYFDSD